jgi:hypothetical protein
MRFAWLLVLLLLGTLNGALIAIRSYHLPLKWTDLPDMIGPVGGNILGSGGARGRGRGRGRSY